jgi:hypothetical protein
MNTEQDNKRVSDAYREVANEVTPAELDERILASAARDARSRYGLARAWVRPVAWAATIGLSLAFMLELTWFADAPPEVPAERVVAPATDEASLLRGAGKQARRQAESAQLDAALSYSASQDLDHACDTQARMTAESWYQCIRDLRERGLVDEAAAELEALLRAFPDFREPPPE